MELRLILDLLTSRVAQPSFASTLAILWHPPVTHVAGRRCTISSLLTISCVCGSMMQVSYSISGRIRVGFKLLLWPTEDVVTSSDEAESSVDFYLTVSTVKLSTVLRVWPLRYSL